MPRENDEKILQELGVDNEMGAILTYGTEVATASFEVLELVIPWFVVKITLSSLARVK